MRQEKFITIRGYDGLYKVSDRGRVFGAKRGKFLKPIIKTHGYAEFCLCKNGKQSYRRIHKLVAMAFIPNPLQKRTINHKNGIKIDNRAENLEWMTYKENIAHGKEIGLINNSGESHYLSKLTEKKVLKIRELLNNNKLTIEKISSLFRVSRNTIFCIKKGITWKHCLNN